MTMSMSMTMTMTMTIIIIIIMTMTMTKIMTMTMSTWTDFLIYKGFYADKINECIKQEIVKLAQKSNRSILYHLLHL